MHGGAALCPVDGAQLAICYVLISSPDLRQKGDVVVNSAGSSLARGAKGGGYYYCSLSRPLDSSQTAFFHRSSCPFRCSQPKRTNERVRRA